MSMWPHSQVGDRRYTTPECPSWAALVEWLDCGPVDGCAATIDWHVPDCKHCRERIEFIDELKRLLAWRPIEAPAAAGPQRRSLPERP